MLASTTRVPFVEHKVNSLGSDNSLLFVMNDVPARASSVGAVLWGLGVAEVRTARRLAKRGIGSLQLRIGGSDFNDNDRRNEIYRSRGVEYCKAAMDRLGERGATKFILMGNCACANVSLNAALEDPRVVGLILTNPYIPRAQRLDVSLWRQLARPATWKKVFAGTAAFRERVRVLVTLVQRGLGVPVANPSSAAERAGSNLEFPEKLAETLRGLSERGVRILLACSTGDDSMEYLTAKYRTVLGDLQARGHVRFEAVHVAAHVFSTDDRAAELLNDAISRWVDSVSFGGE